MSKLKIYPAKYVKVFSWIHLPLYGALAKTLVSKKNILIEPGDIEPDKKYLFAVNHQGIPDFFVVFFGLPFWIHRQLTPYRFFVSNPFFKNPVVRWMLMSFGGFPAKEHRKIDWGILAAERALQRNETVVIFPEGRVSLEERKYPAKRGVEILAKTPDIMIVPVRVKWYRSEKVFKSYYLAVGKPFDASQMTASQIMDRVYDLEF